MCVCLDGWLSKVRCERIKGYEPLRLVFVFTLAVIRAPFEPLGPLFPFGISLKSDFFVLWWFEKSSHKSSRLRSLLT